MVLDDISGFGPGLLVPVKSKVTLAEFVVEKFLQWPAQSPNLKGHTVAACDDVMVKCPHTLGHIVYAQYRD